MWPTDNDLEIPTLPIEACARSIPDPVIGWGTLGRRSIITGTLHFYVDDYRFSTVLKDPSVVVATQVESACEPNITILETTPAWESIYSVGRKRSVSAALASQGVRLFVDLCVPDRYQAINLLGVPVGWTAYSTRAFPGRLDEVVREYRAAAERAAGTPLFLMVGGGEQGRALARELPGAVHVPSALGSATARRVKDAVCNGADEAAGLV